jgi:hypothetical protein
MGRVPALKKPVRVNRIPFGPCRLHLIPDIPLRSEHDRKRPFADYFHST